MITDAPPVQRVIELTMTLGRSGQRLGSRLRAVYLEDVRGDIDGGLVVHALKLKVWVVDGFLKTRDEFGRGFPSPAVDEDFACQRSDKAPRSDEFLIGSGQGTDWRKFALVALPSQQCVRVAFSAGALVCQRGPPRPGRT